MVSPITFWNVAWSIYTVQQPSVALTWLFCINNFIPFVNILLSPSFYRLIFDFT